MPVILVFGDTPISVFSLFTVLSHCGHEATTAMTYGEATLLISQNQVDLIVIELSLSSKQICECLADVRRLSAEQRIPILLVNDAPKTTAFCLADFRINRDFRVEEFIDVVNELLAV